MKSIFYSWQSDTPKELNHEFIKLTLEEVLKDLNYKYNIEESPRDEIIIDHDIKDVPGMPPIFSEILKKIDESAIYIPDFTFVASTGDKPLFNTNVAIEFGYAYKTKGYEKIIALMNTEFGLPSPENMPFNVRHLDFPIQYKLNNGLSDGEKELVQTELKKKLLTKIELILKKGVESNGDVQLELTNESVAYLNNDLNSILILANLKVTNDSDRRLQIFSVDLEMEFIPSEGNAEWITFRRVSLSETRVVSHKGTVLFGRKVGDKLKIATDNIRIDDNDTIDFYIPFEHRFGALSSSIDEIKVRGEIKYSGNKNLNFEGFVKVYQG